MVKKDKRILLLNFFREQEIKGKVFTFQQAANVTGYSPKSVSKYVSEKLKGKYIYKSEDGGWFSVGLSEISNDDFIQLMSQSTLVSQLSPDKRMFQKLIKRSLDAFILALEIYNRPSLNNRVEAFVIMMINSWELFLKAEILGTQGKEKVFYKDGKSISITDALSLCFQDTDPVKLNIEELIRLRDKAIHLLLPELQSHLSRLFQAAVLNYQDRYHNQTGSSPLAGQSVGMLSLVIDGPEPEIGIIKESYGDITASQVYKFIKEFKDSLKIIDSERYSIPIDYKLVLTKKPFDADLTLSIGNSGQQAIIITQAKNLHTTHPYTTKLAIKKINESLGKPLINNYSFQAICYKHKIKQNNNSSLHNYTDKHRYSDEFIIWVVKNIKEHNEWLEYSLNTYKSRKNSI